MNQSYFLKNLPAPLQPWVRPMLLVSIALHGLLLAIPMPPKPKPEAPKKELEKVKITQIPTTPPAPKSSVRPSPRPTPLVRQSPRPKPTPVRRPSTIPPITQARAIPRPQSQPSSQPTPQQTPSPTVQQTPPPPAPEQTSSPAPEQSPNSEVQNPFADFPFPDSAKIGSLGLLSGETDKSARNTADGLDQVVSFYNSQLPSKKFTSTPVTDEADLKVYEVAKEGGERQYLHLISKEGKTVIVLASQQITDLKSLKDAEARTPEEIAFYDIVKQLENDEELALAAVEPGDITKFPEPDKFNDTNKFEFRSKTVSFKPMSPQELFAQVEASLTTNGFTQISPEGNYGGTNVLTYKVTQGSFSRYLYFVPTSDNRTVIILSKDSPF
jgi:outer membrane biosynthesis protein TonB